MSAPTYLYRYHDWDTSRDYTAYVTIEEVQHEGRIFRFMHPVGDWPHKQRHHLDQDIPSSLSLHSEPRLLRLGSESWESWSARNLKPAWAAL